MAIIGGFLGGGVELVPAGYGQLCLQWTTQDRENLSVTFSGTSTSGDTFTVASSADGRAEVQVPVGTWTVSVTHEGSYEGDGDQTVIVESTQSYLVFYYASAPLGAISLGSVYMPAATFEIVRDSDQEVIYSGAYTATTIGAGLGSYTVTVTQYGVTQTIQSMSVAGETAVNWTDLAIILTPSDTVEDLKMDGTAVGAIPVRVLIGSDVDAAVVMGQWSDGNDITQTTDVSALTEDTALPSAEYSDHIAITESGTWTAPITGTYEILMVGGGGGGGGGSIATQGGAGGGGGNGGRIMGYRLAITAGTEYEVTVGAGGTAGNAATASTGGAGGTGGTTTFGTYSVAGGSGGSGGASRTTSSNYGGVGGYGSNNSSMTIFGTSYSASTYCTAGSAGTYNSSSSARASGGDGGPGVELGWPTSTAVGWGGDGGDGGYYFGSRYYGGRGGSGGGGFYIDSTNRLGVGGSGGGGASYGSSSGAGSAGAGSAGYAGGVAIRVAIS